jgi:hypothetical protein
VLPSSGEEGRSPRKDRKGEWFTSTFSLLNNVVVYLFGMGCSLLPAALNRGMVFEGCEI